MFKQLLVLIPVFLIILGCGGTITFTEIETCEDLEPKIVELSKENEGLFAREILKMYEVKQVKPSSREHILECTADVKWNRGDDSPIRFYLMEDDEGDQFIGYEEDEG